MTKSEHPTDVLNLWKGISGHLFPVNTTVSLFRALEKMRKDEVIYYSIRREQEKALDEFIGTLQSIPYKSWGNEVFVVDGLLQACLFDRVCAYRKFLEHSRQGIVMHDDQVGVFLGEVLLDWWKVLDLSIWPQLFTIQLQILRE